MENDNFDPCNENDLDDNYENRFDNLKRYDEGYYKLTKQLLTYKKSNRSEIKNKKYVEMYASGDQGSCIRNAISGEYYRGFRVGLRDEDLFFKVIVATGVTKYKRNFFFSSPEEYENFLNKTVSNEMKNKWLKKEELRRIEIRNK